MSMCWYNWFSTASQKTVIESAFSVNTINVSVTEDRNDSCYSTESYYSFESDQMEEMNNKKNDKKNDKRTISTHSDSQTRTLHPDQK